MRTRSVILSGGEGGSCEKTQRRAQMVIKMAQEDGLNSNI